MVKLSLPRIGPMIRQKGDFSMRQFSLGLVCASLAGALILASCGGTEVSDTRTLRDAACDSNNLWAVIQRQSGLQIPDNNASGITVSWDNQNCSLQSVSSAKLEVCLAHTSPTDLSWSITPPNTTTPLTLPSPTPLGSSCDSGQGQVHSTLLLSTIGSTPVTQGRWTLQVKDSVLGNTGTLIQWRVSLQGLQ
jgi:subtilisin-like proprotein convertase family protein